MNLNVIVVVVTGRIIILLLQSTNVTRQNKTEKVVMKTRTVNHGDARRTLYFGNAWTLENLAIPVVMITTANQDDARVTRFSLSV